MIPAVYKVLPTSQDGYRSGHARLWSKAVGATLLSIALLWSASMLGPSITFIGLDVILAVYLTSLFVGSWRYLFLIHPIFLSVSAVGFGIPYDEIGTAWTYHQTYERFIDPFTLSLDTQSLVEQMFFNEEKFGYKTIYVGAIPILWLPKFLFDDVPDIINYYSLGFFTLLYAAVGATLAIVLGTMRKELILIITLYSTVSPTFLEINSVLHRYGVMFLGLFLVLNAYLGFLKCYTLLRNVILVILMIIGLSLVFFSKPPLLLSVLLFIFIERLSANKVPVISSILRKVDKYTKFILFLIGLVIFQELSEYLVPEKYVVLDSQIGGQYASLINIPIVGLILRVIYAALSPFPILDFNQHELYGNNDLFIGVHIISAIFAMWLLLSVISRMTYIVNEDQEIRIVTMFGIGILASLTYSAVGYHVYIAPALPFISVVLLRHRTRVPLKQAGGFVLLMEVLAQTMRLVRE